MKRRGRGMRERRRRRTQPPTNTNKSTIGGPGDIFKSKCDAHQGTNLKFLLRQPELREVGGGAIPSRALVVENHLPTTFRMRGTDPPRGCCARSTRKLHSRVSQEEDVIFSTLLLLDARKVRVAGIQGGSTTSAEACARVEEMLYERPRRPSRYGRRVRLTARLPRARTRQRFFNEETFFEFSPGGPTFNLGVRCCRCPGV